ncbi:hypothetical protein LCM20_01670 [Halobacillus litoralis]|uniref:hypothetical protein n=1 Tax=Halobacillus litoralis TaxID=45668 RepID=UPI001CD3F442|nr:hypothetical protein [Halobacillus litoralis]MCA0969295.1 hypothetical protein [Halobacillus litoralis]
MFYLFFIVIVLTMSLFFSSVLLSMFVTTKGERIKLGAWVAGVSPIAFFLLFYLTTAWGLLYIYLLIIVGTSCFVSGLIVLFAGWLSKERRAHL